MQKCFLLKRRGASLSELEDEKTEKPKTEKQTEKPKVRVKRLPHRRISTTFPAQKVRELVELRVSRHRSNFSGETPRKFFFHFFENTFNNLIVNRLFNNI